MTTFQQAVLPPAEVQALRQSLGERIRARRKELGLTLRGLGQKAGRSTTFLCEIESGKRKVGAETLFALDGALGVSADFLMCGAADARSRSDAPTLPAALVRVAERADLPFRQVLALLACAGVVRGYAGRKPDLERFDWLKFYEVLKEWL